MALCLAFTGCDNSPSSDPVQTDPTDTPTITTKAPEPTETPIVTTQTPEPTDTESTANTEVPATTPANTETETETSADTEPAPPAPPASLIGNVQNPSKITEDLETRTVVLSQKSAKSNSPAFTFFLGGAPLSGNAWAVSGTINTQTVSGRSGHIAFIGNRDASNYANLFINRRVDGSNGIWRNILQDGVRTPASGNENVSNSLKDTTDWTAEFAFVFYGGRLALYLKEPEGEFSLMTYYDTGWDTCTAEFKVPQYADVTLSNVEITNESDKVKALRDKLDGVPENPIASLKVLFIGNSATYVNDIPQTLSRLARKAGYNIEANVITKGGATLADHADSSTDHGRAVLREIAKGYDIVFLQENSNCISSDANKAATLKAAQALDKAIRESGAKTYFYVRPPAGKDLSGYDSYTQCIEYDKLFNDVASKLNAENVYVNRAFAYAIKNLSINLWGSDNAHTSEEGAYLAVCVFFSTLFNTSSKVLDANGLPTETASSLQTAADKVVIEKYIPQ